MSNGKWFFWYNKYKTYWLIFNKNKKNKYKCILTYINVHYWGIKHSVYIVFKATTITQNGIGQASK